MATYSKEKNLISFKVEGSTGVYVFDINSGILYGIKGNPIKTCPRKSEIARSLPYYSYEEGASNLTHWLHKMFINCSATSQYLEYIEILKNADKLDAVGIPVCVDWAEELRYIADNIKGAVAYMKTLGDDDRFNYSGFYDWYEFEKVKNSLGSVATLLTPQIYRTITHYIPNPTKEEIDLCVYYLVRGKMWEYCNGSVGRLFDYIAECKAMEKEPQKVNNFMREYIETHNIYLLKKKEFDDKKMANSYARQGKAWEFSFGNYVVSIPKTAQEIVDEGKNMHHCVGSYVNSVVGGSTYICFIRHKDTPNKCYITCEVGLSGTIKQYYLAYDHLISTDEDVAFREAFRKHLVEVWTK